MNPKQLQTTASSLTDPSVSTAKSILLQKTPLPIECVDTILHFAFVSCTDVACMQRGLDALTSRNWDRLCQTCSHTCACKRIDGDQGAECKNCQEFCCRDCLVGAERIKQTIAHDKKSKLESQTLCKACFEQYNYCDSCDEFKFQTYSCIICGQNRYCKDCLQQRSNKSAGKSHTFVWCEDCDKRFSSSCIPSFLHPFTPLIKGKRAVARQASKLFSLRSRSEDIH